MEKFSGKGAVVCGRAFSRTGLHFGRHLHPRPARLFASITGVLTALNLDILNARIFTASDGRILDVFVFPIMAGRKLVMDEQKWAKFRATLERRFGRKDRCRAAGRSVAPLLFLHKRVPKVSTEIEIDNEASDDFTIVEIFTDDRIGVLFTITHNLHQSGFVDSCG